MLSELKSKLDKAVEILQSELNKVQAGRASAGLVEGLNVDVYGSMMPLNQIANITVPDSKTVAIQPWDKANLAPIEQAIAKSDMGLNPINDGVVIRISIPLLSAERRTELVKMTGAKTEDAKVVMRNIRRDAMEDIKKQGVGEDEQKRLEKQVQDTVDEYVSKMDVMLSEKENEITTI